jgi:dihydrofolate reductase
MIAAVTADGFIGRSPGHLSTTWTTTEDRQFYVDITKELQVMIMGARTFATFNRGLPGRLIYVYTRNPESLQGIDGVIATSKPPADLLTHLESDGYNQVALCGGSIVYGLYLEAGLVDEIYLSLEPVIFGNGINLFDRELNVSLTLLESRALNKNTVLQHYAVNN